MYLIIETSSNVIIDLADSYRTIACNFETTRNGKIIRYITCAALFHAVYVDQASIPIDFYGRKYMYVLGSYILNPEFIPEEGM